MKEIELSQGYKALIDDEDFERVSKYKWSTKADNYNIYALRTLNKEDGRQTTQLLHRFILNIIDPKTLVDHEDHNGLNCQKYNLRIATSKQNMGNRRKYKIATSKFKGVFWGPRDNRWRAQIIIDLKPKHIGLFRTPEEAALAYDIAARKHFGEFALTNF